VRRPPGLKLAPVSATRILAPGRPAAGLTHTGVGVELGDGGRGAAGLEQGQNDGRAGHLPGSGQKSIEPPALVVAAAARPD
jgi:hypothetical protein